MANKNKNKGKAFERQICEILTNCFGINFQRIPNSGAYVGGVLASNGDIHFVPESANRGQKISAAGVVSTYSLVYTTTNAYGGGVLAPNGDIYFVPVNANRGQKIKNRRFLFLRSFFI